MTSCLLENQTIYYHYFKPMVKVGGLVLVKEDNVKRSLWKLAKIEELIESKNGQVIGVKLRRNTRGKPVFINRPLQKLFPSIRVKLFINLWRRERTLEECNKQQQET